MYSVQRYDVNGACVLIMSYSPIIGFYKFSQPNPSQDTLWSIREKNDEWWEGCHDHIQWVFPTKKPSAYNPNAPLLSDEDIKEMREDKEIRYQLFLSFKRFIQFLGFVIADGALVKHSNFQNKEYIWNEQNHNWLRITRAIESLSTLGLDGEAVMLLNAAEEMAIEFNIPAHTVIFWQAAVFNGTQKKWCDFGTVWKAVREVEGGKLVSMNKSSNKGFRLEYIPGQIIYPYSGVSKIFAFLTIEGAFDFAKTWRDGDLVHIYRCEATGLYKPAEFIPSPNWSNITNAWNRFGLTFTGDGPYIKTPKDTILCSGLTLSKKVLTFQYTGLK